MTTSMGCLAQDPARWMGNTRIVKITPKLPAIGFRYAKEGQIKQPGYGEKTEAAQKERQAKNRSKQRFSGKNRRNNRK